MEENNNQYTNGQNQFPNSGSQGNGNYQQPEANGNQQYYQPPEMNGSQQQYYQPPQYPNTQVYAPEQPPKKKHTAAKVIGIIFAVIVLIFVALFVIGLFVGDTDDGGFVTQTTTQSSESSDETQTTEAESSSFSTGTISENKYTNSFAGFGIDLPDSNWRFLGEDEVYEMLGDSSPQKDENGSIYVESEGETAYYDMMMLNDTTGTNIQVVLSQGNGVSGIITSEELYLSNASSGLEDDGTTKVGDTYSITIAGEKYTAVNVDYTAYGTTQTIAVRKVGSDFVTVIITIYSGLDMNGTDYYTDMFYTL